jgi:hypothetical protein
MEWRVITSNADVPHSVPWAMSGQHRACYELHVRWCMAPRTEGLHLSLAADRMGRRIGGVVGHHSHRLEVGRAMGVVRSRDHARSSHGVASDGGSCRRVWGCSRVDRDGRSSRLVGLEGSHDRHAEETESGNGHGGAPLEAGQC